MFEVVEIIANPLDEPSEVWFEPWGMPHTLAPGESFRVVAVSEQRGELEVVRDGSRIAVYAWPGSTMRVYRDEHLVEDFSIKFPELPRGMSTKSFAGFMFGGPGGPGRA
jgi:hypothetical protein